MVLAGAVLGLTLALAVIAGRLGDVRSRTTELERQAVLSEEYAEERADRMAERLFTLTARWNESAETLDRLSAACVADGWCVADQASGGE